jgi:ferredoxin
VRVAVARRGFQLAVIGAAATAAVRVALGASQGGIETYCPFGGLESAWSLVSARRFSCATGELNLTLFLALVGLTLVARKSFCAWICPVGTAGEGLAAIGRRLRGMRAKGGAADAAGPGLCAPPARIDALLHWLRVLVLVLVLVLTARAGELVFRFFDPYYIMFSPNGHDVAWPSYAFLAAFAAAGVVVAMAFCRYLCPLGAALWPFSAAGLLRLARDPGSCTGCRACDSACPHGIVVSGAGQVRSAECTLCMACADACPGKGALRLGLPGGRPARVPRLAVPALVAGLAGAGVAGADLVAVPSYSRVSSAAEGARRAEVEMVVDGLRCVDTARKVAAQLEGVPGVTGFAAYASRHVAVVEYDPGRTDPGRIRKAIEAPFYDARSGQYLFGRFKVRRAEVRQR